MPRHPEDFLPGPFEQRVVDRDRECRIRGEQSGYDQIGQHQSDRVARPAGVGEQSVCAAVMPHPFQPGPGEHSTHRSTAGLRDQTNKQADECWECGCGEAGPEHGQEVGQRARYGGAGKHRRITLTRVVQTPSMFSPSPSKITDLAVPGASLRPTGPGSTPKLRNTSVHKHPNKRAKRPDARYRRLSGSVVTGSRRTHRTPLQAAPGHAPAIEASTTKA